MADPSTAVRVGAAEDGSIRYLVQMEPDALPPVLKRDLETAWDAVQNLRRWASQDVARGFRFLREDGSAMDLLIVDQDARSWASAVDRLAGLHTSYGLSLCLRLLALIDLLGRWREASRLVDRGGPEIRPHPSLLRTAAAAPLDGNGRFDEIRFMSRLAQHLPQAGRRLPPNGALA